MDLLRKAIAAKKQNIMNRKSWKKAESDSDSSDDDAPKRFLRRGDIKKMQEAQNEGKKRKIDKRDAAIETIAKKMKEDAENEATSFAKKGQEDKEDRFDLDNMPAAQEVKVSLRNYGRPITLFGETDVDRFKRLKALELSIEEKEGGDAGAANHFQDLLQKEVERDIQDATVAAMESEKSEEQKAKELAKRARIMAKRHNKYAKERKRDQFDSDEEYIVFYFKRMLSLWELELDQRVAEDKKRAKGKVASATQKQTRSYLHLFFKQLRKKEAPPSVVKNVLKIVDMCMIREYVVANEAYLLMAIGNAAWPMGVTSVGIHERAGRERIFCQNQAHVLNDETSRKYIQAMKRIMTYAQHAFPNVPSKMVI